MRACDVMTSEGPNLAARADWRTAGAVGLCFLVFYFGFAQGQFKGSDEVGVYEVTKSLYETGTMEVQNQRHAHRGADGLLYAPYAVGQSVLALPFYGLAQLARVILPDSWLRALAGPSNRRISRGQQGLEFLVFGGSVEIFFVSLYAPVASALLMALFFAYQRTKGISRRSSLIATALTGGCGYAGMMSIYFLRHTSETLAILSAFLCFSLYRESGSLRVLTLGSIAASATFLVRFPGVLAGPGLAIYVLWCLRERVRVEKQPLTPALAAVVVPLAAACGIHMAVNYAKWGTLLGSPMVKAGLESSASFLVALYGFLLSPGISIFAYSPLLLLLPLTLRTAWRPWRWECIAFLTIAIVQLFFFSNYRYWTGLWSSPGPRYLFPASVLLMLPLGAWLDSKPDRRGRAALVALAVLGAGIQLALLTAEWSAVILGQRYLQYRPEYSFLFRTDASPIVASARASLEGNIGTWLWRLGTGWPGQEAAPTVALLIFALWLAALAAAFAGLRRVARRCG